MANIDGARRLEQAERQEVFLALVTAQDGGMPVAQSKKAVAKQFGITESQVRRIEDEGLERQWPPL